MPARRVERRTLSVAFAFALVAVATLAMVIGAWKVARLAEPAT